MKIISKFKDFYDAISHQYLDKGIVFLRTCRIMQVPKKDLPKLETFEIKDPTKEITYYFSLEIVGFCGKFYPVVVVTTSSEEIKFEVFRKDLKGFYDIDDLTEYVIKNGIPIGVKSKYGFYRWSSLYFRYGETLEGMDRFFKSTKDFGKLEDIFRTHNAPSFVLRETPRPRKEQLILNPMLKNYSFVKVKDPFSAHQELYQYVGGFLNQPVREMIQISDKDKIHKHGFDKWSFRKPPKGKK